VAESTTLVRACARAPPPPPTHTQGLSNNYYVFGTVTLKKISSLASYRGVIEYYYSIFSLRRKPSVYY
jgi:hypothetical protein